MNSKRFIIGFALISLFLIPAASQFVSSETSEITVSDNMGAITVQTKDLTVKIIPGQAHLVWWYGNATTADEMYKVQLVKITEFMGDDEILDDHTELGGVTYNLITSSWTYDIVEGTDEVTITLSLLGLPNGADMYLIMHIYTVDTPIEGSDQVVDALTELKFDIIVENWDFSAMAAGYAIQTYLTEVQHRHRVQLRNGTLAENGNTTRTMQFTSESYGEDAVAYMEWTDFANIYDSGDELIDTIDVGTAYFDDLISPPTEAPGFAEGLAHLFLTYANYGDGNKMVHDPIIGVNADAFTAGLSLYLIPVFSGLAAIAAVVSIIRRRKN
ncbi:MAG TPA: hypothetical protein VMZ29_15950 [Candidatus Bathyarchaeia archaeon]|nr:hypothetical protein [Candidatus Bathyarchaeia archaeon]